MSWAALEPFLAQALQLASLRLLDFEDFAADPFGNRWGNGVANEAPSTAVQPSGKPINFSHSSQVKFLATEYWPVAMTSLMSASLGTNRGANTFCFGIPKAAATLYQKRRVSFSPSSNFGSSLLPLRSSRRRIPVVAAAVRKELIGGFGSITCDNENTFSVVGQTRIESVAREPPPQIPDLFELVDNCLKRAPFFCAEEPDNILQDKPSRPCFRSKFDKVVEEAASLPFETLPVRVRVAEILAGPASCPDFTRRDVFGFERCDVVMEGNLWPVPSKYLLAMWVNFAMEYRFHARPLQAQIKTADPGEE